MSRLRDLIMAAAGAVAPPPPSGMPDVSRVYQGWPFPAPANDMEFPLAVKLVPTVYAIVNRIASDVASVPPTFYRVARDGTQTLVEREPGNITDLWAKANPAQSGFELSLDYQTSLDANGNAYLYLERFGRKGPPQELWSMPGHMVTPVPGPRRTILYYEYLNSDGPQRIAPENVIHIRYWNANANPNEPWPLGMSPLSAARSGFQTRFTMGQWQQKLFERGGQTNLVMSVKDGNAIDDKDVEQMQARMDARFSGLRNAFKPVFLRGVDVVRAGMSLDEMKFVEQAKLADSDLTHIFGMHPILMGFAETTGQGLAFKDALLDYWISCIGAMRIALRDSVLTERLCPLFGRDLICKTNMTGVLAMQTARLDLAKAVVVATGQPAMEPNEGREIMELPPSDDPEAERIHWNEKQALNVGEEGPVPVGDEKQKPDTKTPAEPTPDQKGEAKPAAAVRVVASEDRDVQFSARRKRADANLRRYEKKTEALARGVLARFEASAMRQLKEQAASEGIELQRRARFEADPGRLAFEPDSEDLERAQALFEALVLERGTEVAADAGVEVTLQHARERIARWVREKASFMLTQMSETTAADVRHTIARTIEDGGSWNEVVGAVRKYFSDAQQYRPALVARTETTGAYNYAAMEGLAAAGVNHKRWLTVGDDVVRESHLAAEADGPIALDERFSNGLLYPGEPGADVGEVANCRCVLDGVFDEDSLFARADDQGWVEALLSGCAEGHQK